MDPGMKSRKILVLKLFVTVLVTLLILRYLNLKEAYSTLGNVDIQYLLVVFLIINLDRIFMAYKWKILLKAKRLDPPLSSLVKGYYVSGFLGPVLPATVGDDLIRGYAVSDIGIGSENIVSSIVVERILGTLSLFLLAFLSLALLANSRHDYSGNLLLYMAIIMIISGIGFYYSLEKRLLFKESEATRLKPPSKIMKYLERVYFSYLDYRHFKKCIIMFFFLSIIEHSVVVYSNYLIIESLGFRISFIDIFYTVPSIMFLSRLPISIGKIGVQEGVYVMLLSLVGLTLTDAVTISVLTRVVVALSLLPVILFLLASGRMRRIRSVPG
jgi:glycosyltransferase 2 family protein